MSVDTYLKRKNLAPYLTIDHEGVKILVAPKLIQWAAAVQVGVKQFLIFKSFEVGAEHKHAPT